MQDPDLERWSSAWHDQDTRLIDLRKRTARDQRRLLLWIVADALAAVTLAGVGVWVMLMEPTTLRVVVGIALIAIGVTCCAFLWFNWRGGLAPAADSTRDHLALQVRLARGRLRYATFCWIVITVQAVLAALVIVVREGGLPARFYWIVGAALLASIAGTVWIQVRARRRLAALEALSRTLEEE